MSAPAEGFARAAESLVGAPFLLHGRSPETGLDCVGLVSCALDRAGLSPRAPRGYALRNRSIARHLALAAANGFAPAEGAIRRGDLLLLIPGPAQHHLAVATGARDLVHAHAGVRRVVRQAGPLPWRLARHWRLAPDTEI